MKRSTTTLVRTAVTAVAYFCAAVPATLFFSATGNVSPVRPATGIGLAAILLWGYRVWPGIALGSFFAALSAPGSPISPVAAAVSASAEALLGAYLTIRYVGGKDFFDSGSKVFRYCIPAGVTACAAGAAIGTAGVGLEVFRSGHGLPPLIVTWWLGDMIGALLVAPLILVWAGRGEVRRVRGGAGEASMILLALAAVYFSAGRIIEEGVRLTALFSVPIVLWAAFRFRTRGAITTAAIASVAVVLQAAWPVTGSFLSMQIHVLMLAVVALAMAGALGERDRAEAVLSLSGSCR